MRTCLSCLLFLFVAVAAHAQPALTGVWSGTLSNDSSTVRREQNFEIALTQYREKVYGYSRTSFIVNDTLYYVLKRVRGTVNGDVCEIKDDEIISYNFPGRLDKGVKVTSTFHLNKVDTTWQLDGEWRTNKTKKYYAISGKSILNQQTDLDQSKILPHLDELNLRKDLPFYAESKRAAQQQASADKVKVPIAKPAMITKKKDTITNEVASGNKNKPTAAATTKKEQTAENKSPGVIAPSVAAADVNERSTLAAEIVYFESDSLELSLYDNGEIDGDSVSVLLNGEIILSKQGLKASAIKKSIYIPDGADSATLILYAENLGKYPPNTGLLVIRDKGKVYQVRFSADLQKNAAIVFRRRR